MYSFLRKMKEESAGAMVENVIVMPLVFAIIIFMIVAAFLIHDKATVESAARRGAIYASHCVSDPNYASIVGQSGKLDYEGTPNFSGLGKEIEPYRYLRGGNDIENVVESEVKKIINNTRVGWIPNDKIVVSCSQDNKIIYQEVTVKVTSSYHLPKWFEWFGLETEYKIESEARIAAVDPDEFLRNADLVVDIITQVDSGGKIAKATESIGELASKITKWFEMD